MGDEDYEDQPLELEHGEDFCCPACVCSDPQAPHDVMLRIGTRQKRVPVFITTVTMQH